MGTYTLVIKSYDSNGTGNRVKRKEKMLKNEDRNINNDKVYKIHIRIKFVI